MEAQKRRGRPKKIDNSIVNQTTEMSEETKIPIEEQIDSEQFEFHTPTNDASSFNPLGDAVIERDYSRPQVATEFVPDLEEPTFVRKGFEQVKSEQAQGMNAPQQPSANGSGGKVNSSNPSQSSFNPSQDPFNNPNPAYNELEEKEKKKASEQMVDAVLDTYDTLKTLSAKLGQMDEKKVQKMINEGKIDRNRRITIDEYGNSVSVMEFVRSYNAQVSQAVEPDPAFRKSVKPPMVRVFMKKGWGMTDEQYLLFAFGKDVSLTAVSLIGLKKGIKDILASIQEENMGKQNPLNSESRQTPPPRQEPPSYDSDWNSQPTPTPSYTPPSNEFQEYPQENLTDEDLEYLERIELAQEEMRKRNMKEEVETEIDADTQKFSVDFDNPLRQPPPPDYPEPKVEEHFVKGGEIKDDLSLEK